MSETKTKPMILTEDQAMLKDTAAGFIADAAPIAHMRGLRDSGNADGFARDLWRQFGEMGFNGVIASEDDGGMGLGHVEAGIILEAMGRNLTPSPFLSSAVGAVTALSGTAAGGEYLPGLIAGETLAALAIDEGVRHRPDRIAMTATRSGNGFTLSGKKGFVTHGHVADVLIVAARTAGAEGDADGVTLFAVPADAAGLSKDAKRLADSSIAADVTFDAVQVDADAVLGEVDGGRAGLNRVLNAVRTGASAELLGVGGGAFDRTVAYISERKQFGVIISSFQALQHRAAHLYAELEVARAAVLKAQFLLDSGSDEAQAAVHIAKAFTGNAVTLAVQEGVQMFGGVGMTDEYDIGLFMKRHRVLEEMFGSADYHANALAVMAGY